MWDLYIWVGRNNLKLTKNELPYILKCLKNFHHTLGWDWQNCSCLIMVEFEHSDKLHTSSFDLIECSFVTFTRLWACKVILFPYYFFVQKKFHINGISCKHSWVKYLNASLTQPFRTVRAKSSSCFIITTGSAGKRISLKSFFLRGNFFKEENMIDYITLRKVPSANIALHAWGDWKKMDIWDFARNLNSTNH